MLTECPPDVPVYEWTVGDGYFRPGKSAHSEGDLTGGVTAAHQAHKHCENGAAD